MNSLLIFIASIIIMATAIIIVQFKSLSNAVKYLKSEPDVTKGIILFILFGIIFGLIFQKANAGWLEYTEVYLGIDYPRNQSAVCVEQGTNEKLTSNGGIRQNMFTTDDDLFQFNIKYTHHSCAFNGDRNVYDAIGAEAVYRIDWK